MTRPVSFYCRVIISLELYRENWQGGYIYVTNFPYEINTALGRYSGFHFILLPKNIKSFKDDFECSVRATFRSIVNADIYYYDPQLIASSLAKYFLKDNKTLTSPSLKQFKLSTFIR